LRSDSDRLCVDQDAIEKLRVDIAAGWQQVEEGKVSEFDPEAVKCHGREKLAALRAAIREGLDSGPAEPFDIEAILAEARANLPVAIADLKREARANGLTDPEIDAELQAWRRMAALDWSQCPAVERVPGKMSGAWVLKGTRMPVSVVVETLEAGASIDEIMQWYEGLDREQIKAVIEFAVRKFDR
jgi:uncharacterized protein (DUF433 family)